jgi:peptidoglycan/LPS O-acetylase OafA/YrhL
MRMNYSQLKVQTSHVRYIGLDGYRFLAASLVLFYHFNEYFGLNVERWGVNSARLPLMVDFFFVLSGFVISTAYGDRLNSRRDYIAFLRSRIARIYPLHALTLAASLGIGVAGALLRLPVNHPEIFVLSSLPANLLLQQAWGGAGP